MYTTYCHVFYDFSIYYVGKKSSIEDIHDKIIAEEKQSKYFININNIIDYTLQHEEVLSYAHTDNKNDKALSVQYNGAMLQNNRKITERNWNEIACILYPVKMADLLDISLQELMEYNEKENFKWNYLLEE
jgi:hypothetical protein